MLKRLVPIVQRIVQRQVVRPSSSGSSNKAGSFDDVYTPDYLDSLKPKYPQYKCLNVKISGYDFPILESYQSYLNTVANYMDINVSDGYAAPPTRTKVTRLKPKTNLVEAEYQLTTYVRHLILNDVDSPVFPIFVRVAQAALPEGVELHIDHHTEVLENERYLPDRDLVDLEAELERVKTGGPTQKKK